VITVPAPATTVNATNTTDAHSKNAFQLSTDERSFIMLDLFTIELDQQQMAILHG
jgi:hypothetical protein